MNAPFLFDFQKIGDPAIGYISIIEELKHIPFKIRRVYWTYFTPQNVQRGGHANINKELILIAVAGSIKVSVEMQNGYKNEFLLDRPDFGLYLPKLSWHSMTYSHNAVQLALASNLYSENDYIREYDEFIKYGK